MANIEFEKKVVAKMIAIYCKDKHPDRSHEPQSGLCAECTTLLEYAMQRLSRCPHGNRKPACKRCTIHCYLPTHREQIRNVMRHAGPRMLFIDPVAAIRHLLNR